MVAWSLASMAHGMMTSLALVSSKQEFFLPVSKRGRNSSPKKERAVATGILNAGTNNAGAIITPLILPWITIHWGWRSAFFLIGGWGLVGLALWLWIYRKSGEHLLPRRIGIYSQQPT
jgi:MFS transporter, ACS family, hexuronate transporter